MSLNALYILISAFNDQKSIIIDLNIEYFIFNIEYWILYWIFIYLKNPYIPYIFNLKWLNR